MENTGISRKIRRRTSVSRTRQRKLRLDTKQQPMQGRLIAGPLQIQDLQSEKSHREEFGSVTPKDSGTEGLVPKVAMLAGGGKGRWAQRDEWEPGVCPGRAQSLCFLVALGDQLSSAMPSPPRCPASPQAQKYFSPGTVAWNLGHSEPSTPFLPSVDFINWGKAGRHRSENENWRWKKILANRICGNCFKSRVGKDFSKLKLQK